MATRSTPTDVQQEPRVVVAGTSLQYSRALNHQCCRTVEFRHHLQGSEIRVVEFWTGLGCRCICFSSLDVTLDNIQPGDYTITVYETGTLPRTEETYPEVLLLSETIQIRDTGDND